MRAMIESRGWVDPFDLRREIESARWKAYCAQARTRGFKLIIARTESNNAYSIAVSDGAAAVSRSFADMADFGADDVRDLCDLLSAHLGKAA